MPAKPPLQLECITYASGRVEIRRAGAGAKDANRAAGRGNPRAGKGGGAGAEKEPALDETVVHAKKMLAYTGFEPGDGERRRRGKRGRRGAARPLDGPGAHESRHAIDAAHGAVGEKDELACVAVGRGGREEGGERLLELQRARRTRERGERR